MHILVFSVRNKKLKKKYKKIKLYKYIYKNTKLLKDYA